MEKYYCSVAVTPLRANPSELSEMVSQLLYGETCEIIEIEGGYSKIKMDFDGCLGWCDHSVLKKQKEAAAKHYITQTYGVFDVPEGNMLLSAGSEMYPIKIRPFTTKISGKVW